MAHIIEVERGQKMSFLILGLRKNTEQKCPYLSIECPHNADGHHALDGRNSHTASSAFYMSHHKWPAMTLRDCSCNVNATVNANFWTMSIGNTGGNIVHIKTLKQDE